MRIANEALRMRILVTVAAGSGTTTLAEAIADREVMHHLDADDFFWLTQERSG